MEVPLTPLEFARRTRALYADREALVDGDLRLTYEQFFQRCDRWSAALQKLGVRAGDRVAYIAPNTHAQLESFYAVPQIGAVLVPINYRLSPGEFEYIITHSGATIVCAHEDFLESVDRIRGNLPGVRHFVALEGTREHWLDYETLVANASAACERPPAEVRSRARKGLRVVTAGAPPAAATIERIEGELGWTITHVYGLTETAPFITVCESRPEHETLSGADRAVVKARQGVELMTSGDLRVVDEEGRDVPRDGATVGEIIVRGNVVMKGYYHDPEATATAFRGGYFHSGDAAVVHPDGYVDIRDRLKDVIISGGENISSVEVEGVLLRHPAVQEAAVVGLPDAKWGEAPHAFVVLKPAATATSDELRTFTRDRLAHFKAPHSVTFIKELPKTATGKIQKYVLRARQSAIAAQ